MLPYLGSQIPVIPNQQKGSDVSLPFLLGNPSRSEHLEALASTPKALLPPSYYACVVLHLCSLSDLFLLLPLPVISISPQKRHS